MQRASAVEMGVPPEMVYNALNQSQLLELDDRTYFHLDRAQPLHWKQLVAGALPSSCTRFPCSVCSSPKPKACSCISSFTNRG